LDGESAVGCEGEQPAVVVDVLMVLLAYGEQVVEVGATVVPPPDDVVQSGAAVAHVAAGDRTGRVDGAERSALSPVRQAGRASEVEFAGSVDDHRVAHGHGVHDRGLEEIVEHPLW
jgi:hypothetical protein